MNIAKRVTDYNIRFRELTQFIILKMVINPRPLYKIIPSQYTILGVKYISKEIALIKILQMFIVQMSTRVLIMSK